MTETTTPSTTERTTFRELLRLAKGHGKAIALVIVLGVVSAVLTLLVPRYATKFFTNGAFAMPGWPVILGLVLFVIGSGIASALQFYCLQRVGESIVRKSRKQLGRHLLQLPIREYDQRGAGDLLSRLNNDTSRLRTAFLQGITAITSGMILVIGAAVSMLFIDPVLFGTAVLLLTLVLSLMLLSTKFIEKASLSSQTALGDLTSSMGRDLAGIRSIRAANATRSESEQLDKLVDRTWLTGLSVARIQAVINPLSTIGLEISAIVVLGLGIFRVSTGQLPIEGLTQFIMLLFILISPLSQVMYAGSQIGESLAALTRIKQVERIPEETANDNTDLNIIPDTEPENKGTGDTVLEFDRVCFSYSTEGRVDMDPAVDPTTILHGLTFTVRRGSTVALVGPSGAGKSTVLQLVERFYEPESGTISVFGRDVSRCDRRELRTHLAYVEQDAPAITGTMRDNLLLGLPRTPDEKCEEVLRSVNLGHILERSGQGLDTPIGENGVALSGGERQRLAVARALLSPAEIVLLDEATANLDSRNERLITGLLTDADRSRTLIVVAHRLATVIDADVIHVMQHGRIIASGTHETLVESVPLYRDLAKEQHLI